MKVYVLSLGILSEHAQDYVAGVYATRWAAAIALDKQFEKERGADYWWGVVTSPTQVGDIEEFEVQS